LLAESFEYVMGSMARPALISCAGEAASGHASVGGGLGETNKTEAE
jgi:hypothetical protein